ncbi:MAG: dephospho-CoA kinase [Candidatus Omnitrophica bacterium]|nr:dephospho-CoA kinase [Candidatus Omnitrophota bacterium]
MPVFGLTGNLASGKSTVLALLQKKGAAVFDSDRIIHRWYQDRKSEVYKKVVLAYPHACVKGVLVRGKLRAIVFDDRKQLTQLEKIVHPAIVKELTSWVAAKKKAKTIAVAEVPLLFEKKLETLFDGVILVRVRPQILIERIRKQYRCSRNYARKRLALYLPVDKKIKKSDFMVDNSSDRAALIKETDALWSALKNKVH